MTRRILPPPEGADGKGGGWVRIDDWMDDPLLPFRKYSKTARYALALPSLIIVLALSPILLGIVLIQDLVDPE